MSASPSPTRENSQEHAYYPDFIARVDDGKGEDDLLNLIIEVTGQKKKDKLVKAHTARTLWVPAINKHGGFGRWGFIEITDPWDAKNLIRRELQAGLQQGRGEEPMAVKEGISDTKVEALTHKDKRVNIPTEELRDFVASTRRSRQSLLSPRSLP